MTVASFKGTEEQQALAEEVYRLMTTQASLFAIDAPIRQSLRNLADFLARSHKSTPEQISSNIDAALRANDELFKREEQNGQVIFVTSRIGNYVPRDLTDTHSFKQRLHEPENPLPIDDISVVVSTSRPAITSVEPVYISDYWQVQAGGTPVQPEEVALPVTPSQPEVEPSVTEVEATPVIAETKVEVTPIETVVPTAPKVEEVVIAATVPTVSAKSASNTQLNIGDGVQIDLSRPIADLLAEHSSTLRHALNEKLDQDPLRRIIHFGRSYLPEANLASLGKNDMRRIRDYIIEVGEPLLDTAIIADLYYHNPRQSGYENFRFSLNYRLSREKDFEFVGVEGARLWTTKGLPAIGTKRVKASEMAQLTSFLVEGFDDSEASSGDSTMHVLTFFEWEYGILPLDNSLASLLPAPMLPDQRSAVLRFDSPQHYTNYLVEVRYPTGNRGGWLQGLEDFFHGHLVPGAIVTIARSEEPNVFTISYEEASETTERLLTLDEKKNKLAFANLSFFSVVDEEWLLSQQRYGKLRNLKSLPMNERRKSETILEHVFETMGDSKGSASEPRYSLSLNDLLVGYNVLRPGSRSFLTSLLDQGDEFAVDSTKPGTYIYTPEPREVDDNEDEEEEESYSGRRYGRYEDDDD